MVGQDGGREQEGLEGQAEDGAEDEAIKDETNRVIFHEKFRSKQ